MTATGVSYPQQKFQHTAARRRLATGPHLDYIVIKFQHTAARRRLGILKSWAICTKKFQHTAARRRLAPIHVNQETCRQFQHTAARRRLVHHTARFGRTINVSTHSRPKAAGMPTILYRQICTCFNTQPPEGGWLARGQELLAKIGVSTHSRPKAAGKRVDLPLASYNVSTHSRLTAASVAIFAARSSPAFQHTAARRRLVRLFYFLRDDKSFNTQPPEGGWTCLQQFRNFISLFQHTAARRRLGVEIFRVKRTY